MRLAVWRNVIIPKQARRALTPIAVALRLRLGRRPYRVMDPKAAFPPPVVSGLLTGRVAQLPIVLVAHAIAGQRVILPKRTRRALTLIVDALRLRSDRRPYRVPGMILAATFVLGVLMGQAVSILRSVPAAHASARRAHALIPKRTRRALTAIAGAFLRRPGRRAYRVSGMIPQPVALGVPMGHPVLHHLVLVAHAAVPPNALIPKRTRRALTAIAGAFLRRPGHRAYRAPGG